MHLLRGEMDDAYLGNGVGAPGDLQEKRRHGGAPAQSRRPRRQAFIGPCLAVTTLGGVCVGPGHGAEEDDGEEVAGLDG